jgi:hypothetical protein
MANQNSIFIKISCKVAVVFVDEEIDAVAAAVIEIAVQHLFQRQFPSITLLHKFVVLSPRLFDVLQS